MSKRTAQLERLRDLPNAELQQALGQAQDELFRLRLGHYTNQVENTLSLREKQREVARIQTILQARGAGLETQRASTQAKDE